MTMFSFSADSLEHGMAWRSRPYPQLPRFSTGHHPGPADDVVCLARRDWADIYHSCKNDAAGLLKVIFFCQIIIKLNIVYLECIEIFYS